MRRAGLLKKALVYFVVLYIAAMWVVPLYIMVVTALKTPAEITQMRYLTPPENPQLKNFADVMREMGKALFDTTVISLTSTFLCVVMGVMAGYYLARVQSRVTFPLAFAAMLASFLPYQIILIPLTTLESMLHLTDTYAGLVFAYTMLNLPLAILVTMTFFLEFPREMEEAAVVDGCDPLTAFFNVVLPLSKPAIASTAILVFTSVWNEFLIALTIGGTAVRMVAPVVYELKGCYAALWNLQMAGSLIASIPPLVLFVVMGKYFIRGLLAGAVK